MGFKKSSVPDQVAITLNFRIIAEDGTEQTVPVKHIFRQPALREREEYQRRVVKVKGRKVISTLSDANWYLWGKCILSVEGYDDLPSEGAGGDWKLYFQDDNLRIHVDEAVNAFLDITSAEESSWEKKSAQS